jgi:hypothetical protein
MKPHSTALAALFCTGLSSLAGPANPPPMPPPDGARTGWSFRAAPYLWALGLDGDIAVRGLEVGVDLPFSDILSDLDFSMMAAFEARNGPWGITVDINYSKLSDSANPRGDLLTAAKFEMDQFMGNVTISYRLVENEGTVVDLYGGARLNWLDAEVSVFGPKGGAITRSGDEAWADALVGIRFQTPLSTNWSLRAVGDIGAGDSDLTWQAMGIFVRRLSDTCNLGIGYRAIGVDYQDGGFTYDITSHGPILGVEWTF